VSVAGVRCWVWVIPRVIPEVVPSSRNTVEPTSANSGTDMIGNAIDVKLSDVIAVGRCHSVWTVVIHTYRPHTQTYSLYATKA